MKKLLEKLNLTFDVQNLKRGKTYYNESCSVIFFEILGGCFDIEDTKVFVNTMWDKLQTSFPNIKYFSLKLDSNASKSLRKQIFEALFHLNFDRKKYDIRVQDDILLNFHSNPNKEFDLEVCKAILNHLGLESTLLKDIEQKIEVELPVKPKYRHDYVQVENAKDYALEELPFTTDTLDNFFDDVKVVGKIFSVETKNTKKKVLNTILITNYKESVTVKFFDFIETKFKVGDVIEVVGKMSYDNYTSSIVLNAISINSSDVSIEDEKLEFEENEIERAELHVHSQYDTEDAIPSVSDYYKVAKNLGIKSLAVCDKENIQNFFGVEKCAKDSGIKGIYGTELKVLNDTSFKIFYDRGKFQPKTFVGLDIETTGLSSVFDDIIEISAYKEEDGKLLEYSVLVSKENGDNTVSDFTTELTSITKEMLDSEGIEVKDALKGLVDFIGDAVIVAHNATFDVDFIEYKIFKHLGIHKKYSFVDTMNFSRVVLRGKANYKLDTVANALGVSLEQHHRAIYDAKCCYDIFFKLMGLISRTEISVNDERLNVAYAEVRTTTVKALNSLNEKPYKILKQTKVEGLKNSYVSVLSFNGSEVEEIIRLSRTISSLKVNTVYKENEHFYNELSLLNNMIDEADILKHSHYFTVTMLVRSQEGLKDFYKLLSLSHTKRITKRGVVVFLSDLDNEKLRKNVLIGSSSRSGIFSNIYFKGLSHTLDLSFFDYLEINPKEAYYSIDDNVDDEKIHFVVSSLLSEGKRLNIPIIVACDAHYLYKKDLETYKILNQTNFVGNVAHKYKYSRFSSELPIYSTSKLLKKVEEDYKLSKEETYKLVVENPNMIADSISSDIYITPKSLFVPTETFLKDKQLDVLEGRNVGDIKNEFMRLINLSLEKYMINGILPEYIQKRVDREVSSITEHGYHIIYYISYLLVKKSLMDGYIVGSRGSVGSSFVANLMGITEVNALKPHYRCPKCHYQIYKDVDSFIKIDDDKEHVLRNNLSNVSSGFDLEKRVCPCCGKEMVRDGHDIPFETFLGFDGDKVPDIDLNFASVYQAKAHLFTKELFGENNVVRAGTISKFAEKTASNTVKEYFNGTISDTEVLRRSSSLLDVKRTTGQHASGIIVIPEGMEYEDFTPVQYPANDREAWLTTHFEYSNIHDNLLKLDILGHIDPTVLKALMDEVKKNPSDYPFKTIAEIPFCDEKIYDLLRKDSSDIVNALGISEFGTNFVMGMLKKIDVKTFSDLVKVSGLSHGTDVWQNNGEDLVCGNTRYGVVPFEKTIGCRDDIMVQLMAFGLKSKSAFDIMEFVRKGKLHKGETEKWEKYKKEMIEANVPEWYIWSLSKIKYMFPKAHAIAYVMSALRIAWFKAYKPLVFYKVYLSIRDKKFDTKIICSNDIETIENKISSIKEDSSRKAVDFSKIPMLEMAKEMILKGFKILPPNVNKSSATDFLIVDDTTLLTPFNMMDGVGDEIAKNIEANRTTPFISLEDLKIRGKANKKFIDGCKNLNILNFE